MSISRTVAALLLTASAAVAQPPAGLEKLTVLEDRAKPEGRKIELAYLRLKSTAARPGAPIVYLDGGPGGSGVGLYRIDTYRQLFDELRSVADVILLSQRGTGVSTPRLTCRDASPVPADLFRSAARMAEVLEPRATRCAAELRARGIDLSAYHTNASADDLDDLRRALGAPTISLFGFSYGTHLALAAARRHPGSIDRLILAGTEGPDHSQKYPHTFDLQLARLAALEGQGDLVTVTHAVMAQLEKAPVTVVATNSSTKQSATLTIGKEGFQYLLRRDIGDTNDTRFVIETIRNAARGDYAMLTRIAGRRYAEFLGGMALMGTAVDCASGTSPERMARITRELPGSLLGAMTNFPFPEVCDVLELPALPDAFRAPVVSTLPALFISGALDSNTPPYQAEEVRWGFPNSVHVIVENAGHESTLPLADTRRLMVDFLKGVDVAGRRIVAPSPLR
jgi:pimeloyl-ACP methyl ester carboxylesterase